MSSSIILNQNLKFIRLLLIASIVLVFLIDRSVEQDIYFPGRNQLDRLKKNNISTSTQPPEECGPSMVPTITVRNGTDEVFCECIQGHLYYMNTDKCYTPYSKGPCDEGKYLVLPANKTKTECVENPCENGKVFYKGSCYSLLVSGGPCEANETLVISEEFYEPTCKKNEFQIGLRKGIIEFPMKPCSPGSRRDGRNHQCHIEFDPPLGH